MATPKRAQHIEFYLQKVLDKKESARAGTEIWRDDEYVRIKFPGDNKKIVEKPAHEECIRNPETGRGLISHAEMWPEHYAAFKAGLTQVQGTSLYVLKLTPGVMATLKANNIETVEQLADMPDGNIRNLGMGYRMHVNAAKAYLEAREKGGSSAEVAALKAELEQMKAMMADMMKPASAAPSAPEEASDDEDDDDGPELSAWAVPDLLALAKDFGLDPNPKAPKPVLIKQIRKAAKEARAAKEAA